MRVGPTLAKMARYATVSAISTTLSLGILGALVATGATSPGWANIVATAVGTVPSFELNRRWVWGKTGRRSLRAEMGPYWALAFSGLVLSTIAVSVTTRWAAASGWGVGARTVVAEAANLATFGSLWIAQYCIADRILFRAQPQPQPQPRPGSRPPMVREDTGGPVAFSGAELAAGVTFALEKESRRADSAA